MRHEKELIRVFLRLADKMESVESQLQQILLNARNPLGDIYLDADEVCILLKVCKRTLQKYRDESSISFIQVGGKILYKTNDIKEMMDKNYQPAINF